jgi:hypothetical protein
MTLSSDGVPPKAGRPSTSLTTRAEDARQARPPTTPRRRRLVGDLDARRDRAAAGTQIVAEPGHDQRDPPQAWAERQEMAEAVSTSAPP